MSATEMEPGTAGSEILPAPYPLPEPERVNVITMF